jgi:sulfatase modifying factor 1
MWPAEELWRAPFGDFPPSWASAWGDDAYGLWADLTVNGVTQRMRWIEPSGSEGFWMGVAKEDMIRINNRNNWIWPEGHEHELRHVQVEHGFWLADTPCTQAFWLAVTGKNPSRFDSGHEAPDRPVECVSWDRVMDQFVARFAHAAEWCTGDRLCLPTELQWEYAARAGTRSAYWWGDGWFERFGNVNVVGTRSWDDKQGTTPVRRYAPNPWGLYDVHGNVWEWCANVWEHVPVSEIVVRGGSWLHPPHNARAAYRRLRHSFDGQYFTGFRFALRSPAGPEAR